MHPWCLNQPELYCQYSPGWPLNPGAAVFKPGQQEHDVSGASTTCSETSSLESSPRALPLLKKMLADVEVELEEERRWRGCLENELEDMKAKRVEWQRLVRGNLERICDLEEQLRWSEAATQDRLQEVEDLKIELDKERCWRGCFENEFTLKDGALTQCHCEKDNTWRRSLGGNSVDSNDSTPEEFEVSLRGSDLKSLDEGSSPLTEPSVSMPRSDNWRCGTKSDKQTDVAAVLDDGSGLALSTFQHPMACADSKSLIEVDSVDDGAAFGKMKQLANIFHHLTPDFAAELLESVASWTEKKLQFSGVEQIIYMMDVMLDDRDLCSANRYMDAMVTASKAGRMDAVAVNKQKVMDLFMQSKGKECC
eukprot:Skav208382  [mRNA]  locus=scaffold3508:98331:100449:+ [translate_table: standard]